MVVTGNFLHNQMCASKSVLCDSGEVHACNKACHDAGRGQKKSLQVAGHQDLTQDVRRKKNAFRESS